MRGGSDDAVSVSDVSSEMAARLGAVGGSGLEQLVRLASTISSAVGFDQHAESVETIMIRSSRAGER